MLRAGRDYSLFEDIFSCHQLHVCPGLGNITADWQTLIAEYLKTVFGEQLVQLFDPSAKVSPCL